MKLWKLMVSIAIISLLCLQDHPGLDVQAESKYPRFIHTIQIKAVPKRRRMLMPTIQKEQCSDTIIFQALTCNNEKCHKECKDNDLSNDHDQCLPRNSRYPGPQDESGNFDWDVPPVEKEDDGYDADHEDNTQNEQEQHEKVIGHKEALLHDEEVQRHPLVQRAMPYLEKDDSDFEIESNDNSEDECCCAPEIEHN